VWPRATPFYVRVGGGGPTLAGMRPAIVLAIVAMLCATALVIALVLDDDGGRGCTPAMGIDCP
jgi:hypothetical protein